MEVNLFNASAYSKRMAGSDQDGADQSTLDEGTRSRADAEHIEAGGENATGNVIPEQTEETVEDSTQRSIRDMLDDEGEASVFVNRDPSSRTRSSMKSESSDVMTNSSPSFRF